eukprot:4345578-Amphidinium_carterae.1
MVPQVASAAEQAYDQFSPLLRDAIRSCSPPESSNLRWEVSYHPTRTATHGVAKKNKQDTTEEQTTNTSNKLVLQPLQK